MSVYKEFLMRAQPLMFVTIVCCLLLWLTTFLPHENRFYGLFTVTVLTLVSIVTVTILITRDIRRDARKNNG